MFLYGERKVARDIGSEKLDDFVQLIRQDFSIKEEVIVFQKFDDSWGEWSMLPRNRSCKTETK